MLPYLDNEQLLKMINEGDKLIIAKDIVYRINDYYMKHPGGNCILKKILKIDSNKSNRIILDLCDIDYNFHSKNGKKIWKDLAIGTIRKRSLFDYFISIFS